MTTELTRSGVKKREQQEWQKIQLIDQEIEYLETLIEMKLEKRAAHLTQLEIYQRTLRAMARESDTP